MAKPSTRRPASLRDFLLVQIEASPEPLTLKTLVAQTVLSGGHSSREIRRAVRKLVENGELAYVQRLGHTFIEFSFQKPVRVSRRVVVTPSHIFHSGLPEDIVILLQGGISFGSGSHPTTRLCLRAMDDLFSDPLHGGRIRAGRILDIGTGTGVLLVAGICLGCRNGIGIDIDACARLEAAENFRINGVDKQAAVSDTPIANLSGPFELITANLRPPTLHQMEKQISRLAAETGVMVMSGFREAEAQMLLRHYAAAGWQTVCQAEEKGWAGVTLVRGGKKSVAEIK